jgi:excisionase family DNA binding protein
VSVGVTRPERRPFFTPKTLAAYLALSERTVREMLRRGALPSYRVGGARPIDPSDVDSYLAGRLSRPRSIAPPRRPRLSFGLCGDLGLSSALPHTVAGVQR